MPRFSIVIPNLNSGETLERAIRSLLDQSYPALELIVADGGSTDCSTEILERYKDQIDVMIREKDTGQADAINRGFRCATGEIRGWLCADDELLPGALQHVAELFDRNPSVGIIAGGTERVYPDSSCERSLIRPDAWRAITVRNTLEQPSLFWRAEWGLRARELDTSYDLAFDWEYWCRLKRAGAPILITQTLLSRYHFSRDTKTSTGGDRHVEEGYRIIREYGPHRGLTARLYRAFYQWFDLHGCMDHPPSASALRMLAFRGLWTISHRVLGDVVSEYNWHFASLQERGRQWWGRA
jgi:glycosyltransferase involved in cell wall biosynthesis